MVFSCWQPLVKAVQFNYSAGLENVKASRKSHVTSCNNKDCKVIVLRHQDNESKTLQYLPDSNRIQSEILELPLNMPHSPSLSITESQFRIH